MLQSTHKKTNEETEGINMPTAEEIRSERIDKLLDWAANKEIKTVDPLLQRAYAEFPKLKKATVLEYAQAAYRILMAKKEEEIR